MLSASQRRPSRSGGTCNSWSRLPSAPNRQTSSRRRLKSSPACNMIFQASLWFGLTPSSVRLKGAAQGGPFHDYSLVDPLVGGVPGAAGGGGRGIKSLPRLSGEYPAQPGEG